MSTNVRYFEINSEGQETEVKNICFARLPSDLDERRHSVKSIRYVCPFGEGINQESAEFYLNFLFQLLDTRKWSYEFGKKSVIYNLDTADYKRTNILTYLTAFRILDEHSEIVIELFKYKDLELNELFGKFQEIHKEITLGKIHTRVSISNHGLIYYSPYGSWKGDINNWSPITVDEIKDNLKKGYSKVQEHFWSHKPLPPSQKLVKNDKIFN